MLGYIFLAPLPIHGFNSCRLAWKQVREPRKSLQNNSEYKWWDLWKTGALVNRLCCLQWKSPKHYHKNQKWLFLCPVLKQVTNLPGTVQLSFTAHCVLFGCSMRFHLSWVWITESKSKKILLGWGIISRDFWSCRHRHITPILSRDRRGNLQVSGILNEKKHQ